MLREPYKQKNNRTGKDHIDNYERNKDGIEKSKNKNKRNVWITDLRNKILEAINVLGQSKWLLKVLDIIILSILF